MQLYPMWFWIGALLGYLCEIFRWNKIKKTPTPPPFLLLAALIPIKLSFGFQGQPFLADAIQVQLNNINALFALPFHFWSIMKAVRECSSGCRRRKGFSVLVRQVQMKVREPLLWRSAGAANSSNMCWLSGGLAFIGLVGNTKEARTD